ncbi:hypothetical protein L210DRAFT_3519830 [Boletus edulis BED1]|uniref:Uncharacterized protein n=1 Tax=Boletus edulis BED1 TaxID=1328754 RepID=A0AAD4C9D7_BOLED|nr:hypothetical protein L210DRAFT_3519830 [Boletus edulis BED1]
MESLRAILTRVFYPFQDRSSYPCYPPPQHPGFRLRTLSQTRWYPDRHSTLTPRQTPCRYESDDGCHGHTALVC